MKASFLSSLSLLLVSLFSCVTYAGPFESAGKSAWIPEGRAKAPHVAYVVTEPNCWYCYRQHPSLEKEIQKGQLKVRWIVGAFLEPSSVPKASAILGAANPLHLLRDYSKALKQVAHRAGAHRVNVKGRAKVQRNNSFIDRWSLATPAIIYRDRGGSEHVVEGLLSPHQLRQVVAVMGESFGK